MASDAGKLPWPRPQGAHLAAVSEGVAQQVWWRVLAAREGAYAKEAEKLLAASDWFAAPLRESSTPYAQAAGQ